MMQRSVIFPLIILWAVLILCGSEGKEFRNLSLVRRDDRKTLVSTEFGEISAAEIRVGREIYQLQFITMEPNALFLPVLLHADMVFYVDTGSGRLSWVDDDEIQKVDLRRGDVYRLPSGTFFFLHSKLEQERKKLRIHAIFSNDPSLGFYSSISRMVLGFNKDVLQAAFGVPPEVVEALTEATKPPPIIRAASLPERDFEKGIYQFIMGYRGYHLFGKSKKKLRTFNILEEEPDFRNANGWSSIVTKKKLKMLKGSDIGVFMVNLSKGSMMGPHWNPMASEIGVVISGSGMVRVVGGGDGEEDDGGSWRVRVDEGDVFGVPRFHPMAQMAFGNSCFVFMGFSSSVKKNHPQFLAGRRSVFRSLDREVVAQSFGVTNATIDGILAGQGEAVILECLSCAEDEERKLQEEEEARRREEEEREREAEEARQREEEEREREAEEARKKEEEEARKREEEEARKREEEEKEHEEARKREEEESRREEEEREREAEEARKKEEEEREYEEARRREEEEARGREKEEEEREREEARKWEEEEAQRREEEARKREEEDEEREARKREEEEREHEEARKREEEEREHEARKREEEEAKKEEEEREHQEAWKRGSEFHKLRGFPLKRRAVGLRVV